MNLREKVLAQKLPAPTLVPTPEWEGTDGQIFVKALTARERLATIDNFDDDATLVDNTIDMLIVGVCDKDGAALFTTDDAKVIGELSSAVINRLMKVLQDKSGMTAEVQERLAKNSKEATPDDSPSS